MRYRRRCLFPAFLFFLACNNPPRQNNTADHRAADSTSNTQVEISPATPVCYASTETQNLIELNLDIKNDSVTGTMSYQISGKDKNAGKLLGTLRGDSIFAEYTFSSEGKESVREVAFLQKGDSLLEGYGDVEEKSGRMVFKNKSALNYGKGVMLKKVNCPL